MAQLEARTEELEQQRFEAARKHADEKRCEFVVVPL
jgi:hypothetical protein